MLTAEFYIKYLLIELQREIEEEICRCNNKHFDPFLYLIEALLH